MIRKAGIPLITVSALLLFLGLVLFQFKQRAEHSLDETRQWALPEALNEASGLAVIDQETLLVHNDEQGVIYRLHLPTRRIEILGQIGEPPIDEDFEGIARHGSDLFMVNSAGQIFHARNADLNASNQLLDARIYDSGLQQICEIEGLAWFDDGLLLPCKTALTDTYRDQLVVFYFNLADASLQPALVIAANGQPGMQDIQPTAIAVTATHWLLISQHFLLAIEPDSKKVAAYHLETSLHRQPEGLAVLPDGQVVIVDDHRNGIGTATRYDSLAELAAFRGS